MGFKRCVDDFKDLIIIAKMASIAIMIGGAIINATTFVGGSYLAKYLSGGNQDVERKRHDLALEKYERDGEAWRENRQRVMDWYSQRRDQQEKASHDFGNTDEALKLYNRVHEAVDQPQMHLGKEPDFKDYYKPSNSQKTGEIAYVAGGMVAVVYLASKFI